MSKIERQAEEALPGCQDNGDDEFYLGDLCLRHSKGLGWYARYVTHITEVEGDYAPTTKEAFVSLRETLDIAVEEFGEDPEEIRLGKILVDGVLGGRS